MKNDQIVHQSIKSTLIATASSELEVLHLLRLSNVVMSTKLIDLNFIKP